MRPRAGSRSVLDRDRRDDDVLDGTVSGTRRNGDDRVDDGARRVVGHLAEDRVLAGQPRGRGDGDEELRAVGAARLAGDRSRRGPALAIASRYGSVKPSSGWISSSKL